MIMNKKEAELHADMTPEERELQSLLGGNGRNCPSPAQLSAAKEGVLPEEFQQQITKHLSQCEMCRMLQEDLSAIETDLTPDASARIQEQISQKTGVASGD